MPDEKTDRRSTAKTTLAAAALLVLTESFYLRPALLSGAGVLGGSDYYQLHIRRLRFAREALLGAHRLPAWYPREAMGTPFSANLQSFPWIPTRLVLLAFDPAVAYAVGIAIASALAAVFTYLFCRRAGLTRLGAVASGVTFAGAGFFASRVMAGHLPLLEAYAALPLLLWLVDRARSRLDLGLLALASACVVVAGHPQLPAYAMASAVVYAIWPRRKWRAAGAMLLGAGLTLAVWFPMLLLIGRSTRILRLASPDNDVSMPYSRLVALVVPGIHGWPYPVDLADIHHFSGFPNGAYFWDTASYIGILPLLAVAGLAIVCIIRRQWPDARWIFLACLGLAAFVCALPVASPVLHLLPGTILRSPARLLYLSTFATAVALGVCADRLRRLPWASGFVLVLLAAHFADQWWFAHRFIQVYPRDEAPPSFQAIVDRETGDARIAGERLSEIHSNKDRHDDPGGFDSIFLARYYKEIQRLAGAPPEANRQWIDASLLQKSALEATGVRFVITEKARPDLELIAGDDDSNLYRVPDPTPRAILLPARQRLDYERPSSDEIRLRVKSPAAGLVQVLETWDPGWTGTVDSAPAKVAPVNGFAIGVPVPAGEHVVRLTYETPGRVAGIALSAASLAGLVLLIASARPRM